MKPTEFTRDEFGMDELVIGDAYIHFERSDNGVMICHIYSGETSIGLHLIARKDTLYVEVTCGKELMTLHPALNPKHVARADRLAAKRKGHK